MSDPDNMFSIFVVVFFFQAEDGIRYLVRSRGLGDVYKRQAWNTKVRSLTATATGTVISAPICRALAGVKNGTLSSSTSRATSGLPTICLLYTSDAADERSSVDLGGRRIIKKKTTRKKNTAQHRQKRKNRTYYRHIQTRFKNDEK